MRGRPKTQPEFCVHPGCGRSGAGGARGFCKLHAMRQARGTPMDQPIRLRGRNPVEVFRDDVLCIVESFASTYNEPAVRDLAALLRRLEWQ